MPDEPLGPLSDLRSDVPVRATDVARAPRGITMKIQLEPANHEDQNAAVTHVPKKREENRSFLTCVTEVARLLGINTLALTTEPRAAHSIAAALRKPLRECATLPEELFSPLMAAAVYDPDPSFCGWFVEPALYVFGRMPLRAGRSPAYAPGGTRDPALDASLDIVDAWHEASMQVFAEATDLPIGLRVLLQLPVAPEAYPPRLHARLESTLAIAHAHPDRHIRAWAFALDRRRARG